MNKQELYRIDIARLKQLLGLELGPENEFIITDSAITGSLAELLRFPARIEGYMLALCTGGEFTVNINLNEHKVKAGEMAINYPENIIELKDFSSDGSGLFMIISPNFLSTLQIDIESIIPLYVQFKNNPVIKLNKDELSYLNDYYKILKKTVNSNFARRKECFRGQISSLVYIVSDIFNRHAADNGIFEDSKKGRRDMLFEKFMTLLSENHKDERELKFYADKLFITPKYLSTLIKEISGRSAADWIDEYVIMEAKSLLKYSNMSIKEISYFLNFPSQSFFGKYFKQHTGMSPGTFKKSAD